MVLSLESVSKLRHQLIFAHHEPISVQGLFIEVLDLFMKLLFKKVDIVTKIQSSQIFSTNLIIHSSGTFHILMGIFAFSLSDFIVEL